MKGRSDFVVDLFNSIILQLKRAERMVTRDLVWYYSISALEIAMEMVFLNIIVITLKELLLWKSCLIQ